jgi:GNAT superfamily N-acetyltransferase
MAIQIIPFQNEILSQAGELLAQQHQRLRKTQPELPVHFEDPAAAQKAVEAEFSRKDASGFAALEQGRLVAYLIGDRVIDNMWGRSGWVRPAGCAYVPEAGIEPVRDLYAALGVQWVGYGVFTHFVVAPAADSTLLQAWFSLSFGIEQVHALANLKTMDLSAPNLPAQIEIRKAGVQDRHILAEFSDVVWRRQIEAPVWAIQLPERVKENREGWAELVNDTDSAVWLAFEQDKAVGVQVYWPTNESLLVPEGCIHLSVAGTRESARGKGIGALLTRYGLAQACAEGHCFCETDWRSTNLLASRFWPRQGFCPVAYRLVRRIDSRIAWARGDMMG